MLSYCLKCKKNTKSKNPKVVRTHKERLVLLSKFAVKKSSKKKQDLSKRKNLVVY